MTGLRLTRRGELTVYLASFLFGVFSIPLGVWWT